MEFVISDGNGLAPYDPSLRPGARGGPAATGLHSVCARTTSALDGKRVAVIGQGSIGLLFSFAAKAAGRRARHRRRPHLPRRRRRDIRCRHRRAVHQRPLGGAPGTPHENPTRHRGVGHQVATLNNAVEAGRFGGTVFYFGVPDDDSYPSVCAHVAQQPHAEIRCDTGPPASARRRATRSPASTPTC